MLHFPRYHSCTVVGLDYVEQVEWVFAKPWPWNPLSWSICLWARTSVLVMHARVLSDREDGSGKGSRGGLHLNWGIRTSHTLWEGLSLLCFQAICIYFPSMYFFWIVHYAGGVLFPIGSDRQVPLGGASFVHMFFTSWRNKSQSQMLLREENSFQKETMHWRHHLGPFTSACV